MSATRWRQVVSIGALVVGVLLFAATLAYVDLDAAIAAGRRLGLAVPLALLISGVTHLTRTWAWTWCFARPGSVGFGRLLRVRLAAEAFSYLTISSLAGDPLKVVLLGDRVNSRDATASVALERISYIVGTALMVGAAAAGVLATQPLSPVWVKIYRGFAIGAGGLAAAIVLILVRRDSYLLQAFRAADRAAGTHVATGKAGRFVAGVGRQLGELVRGDARRLVVLTLSTVVVYICMSAEVWLILRAVGIPISFAGAIAVETFTRVISFASAVIPASLGALEASNVAAAAAIGISAAGAPLALARRLRGLFWAGVGLAIYPRRAEDGGRRVEDGGWRTEDGGRRTESGGRGQNERLLLYVLEDGKALAFERVAGLPIAERVLRSAFRASYERVIVLADPATADRLRAIARDVRGDVEFVTTAAWQAALAGYPAEMAATVIGGGTVVSPALLEDAAALRPLPVPQQPRDVPAGDGWPVSGVLRVRIEDARDAERLASELRDRIEARLPLPSGEDVSHQRGRLVLHVRDREDLADAERTIRRASYKDTDNRLARWNRSVSLPISVALIRTPVTANQLSVALVAIGFYSAWLFSLGQYWTGVLAGFLSLAASVLDGCDGEIARLKYQESALGCWIETFGDYSYYVAIFVGLTIGGVRLTGWPAFYWLGAIALGGTLIAFAFLVFLRSRITAGRPEKLHTIARARFKAEPSWWSRIVWRLSFVATRSAMPYGIFALSLVGLLPLVVVLAAIGSNVYWISLVLKLRHLLGEAPTESVAA
jgi:phosphatidylglycerophosphate synthase